MTTQVLENVSFNSFEYRGWSVDPSIDVQSCDCCGTSTTLRWDASRWVGGRLETLYDAENLQSLFHLLDQRMDDENNDA